MKNKYKVKKSDKPDYNYMVVKEGKKTNRVLAYIPSYHKDGGKNLAKRMAFILKILGLTPIVNKSFYGNTD